MPSTTALFTSLSSLLAHSRYIDVIGNNIANVNTVGYKSNRLMFSSMFSRTFSLGTPPGDTTGGSNPGQIGLGVNIAATQRNFNDGSLSTTGDLRDVAIQGNGFFVVERGGEQLYTRAGAFRPNSLNELVTPSGERVMGYGIDDDFNIIQGALQPLTIPLGAMQQAQASSMVRFSGNLNKSGDLPTVGSQIQLFADADAMTGFQSISGGAAIQATTLLTDVEDPASAGNPLYAAGQIIEIDGAEKGGKALPTARLTITSSTTVQDLMDFMTQALGINTSVTNPGSVFTNPGVVLDSSGFFTIVGNVGVANDMTFKQENFRLLDSDETLAGNPVETSKVATADGESVRTSFIVYDSLGSQIEVDLSLVLESRDDSGTTWRYFTESGDDSDLDLVLGTGTLSFDTKGQLIAPSPTPQITIHRTGTGAETPLTIEMSFAGGQDKVTSLEDDKSNIAATFRDGAPIGTLSNFAIGSDGVIIGAFSNGLTRTIGQVVLARFSNQAGLVDVGGGLFSVGPNSGTAAVLPPQTLGTGSISAGALELSNVDLGQEFIGLILAQTGYSASTRVIRTTDELMQQLLTLGR